MVEYRERKKQKVIDIVSKPFRSIDVHNKKFDFYVLKQPDGTYSVSSYMTQLTPDLYDGVTGRVYEGVAGQVYFRINKPDFRDLEDVNKWVDKQIDLIRSRE